MIYKTFPFGKYKGVDIRDIPSTYVCYALDEFDLPAELDQALKDQLKIRYEIGGDSSGISRESVSRVYKQMAKKYHPDMGGSNEAMAAVSDMYQEIMVNH